MYVGDQKKDGSETTRNWWDTDDKTIQIFTLQRQPDMVEARNQFVISQMVSLAIVDVLNTYENNFSIKWPNDIYYKDKKIAGILIENDLSGHTVYNSYIGVGLNLNQEQFLSDAPNPVSLKQITGEDHDRNEILMNILEQIFEYYQVVLTGNYDLIRDKYMESLYRRDGYHRYRNAMEGFKAKIKDIHTTGLLTLEDEDGNEQTYDFKEVEFVI